MRYKAIHFHLDYVEKYNRILAGIDEKPKNGKTRNLGLVEKAKNEHETKAAVLLHDGIKKGHGRRGQYQRKPGDGMDRYEKMTAAKNAKRVAAGLEPYRPIGKAKKPRKR